MTWGSHLNLPLLGGSGKDMEEVLGKLAKSVLPGAPHSGVGGPGQLPGSRWFHAAGLKDSGRCQGPVAGKASGGLQQNAVVGEFRLVSKGFRVVSVSDCVPNGSPRLPDLTGRAHPYAQESAGKGPPLAWHGPCIFASSYRS